MKIHVFIDAENVPVTNALEAYDLIVEDDDACECDVIGKEGTLPQAYLKRLGKRFRVHNCDYGKNSADLYMTVLIAKAIYEEFDTDILVIISNDRDFAPIIRLAVDKCKQVLLLGLTAQLKGMADSLNRMEVDKRFVTLGVIDGALLSETITVDDLPTGLFEYYQKHYKGEVIVVKRGSRSIELPFIDGMHANQFLDLLRRFGVFNRSQKLDELGTSFINVTNNRVYRTLKRGNKFDNPKFGIMPADLRSFYRDKYAGETIFVKRDELLVEVPFVNGMHLGRFIQLMRICNVWNRSQKLQTTLEKLEEYGLQVKNDYVFYGE